MEGLRCDLLELGRAPYDVVYERQRALVDARTAGRIPDTLVLVEHDAVITLGRKSRGGANILDARGVAVVSVERGGDVTWHGPGQLVCYPVFKLVDGERDAPGFIRRLEAWMITALETLGVPNAGRVPGMSGVWVSGRKVASVGIAVTAAWVTWHGIALNVSTPLADFARINPCGFEAGVMTSVETLVGHPVSLAAARDALVATLPGALGRTPNSAPLG